MKNEFFSQPSAYGPILMSLAAFGLVVSHVAMVGPGREADEGAAAHVFQLLIVAQLPIVAFFALRWRRRTPKLTVAVLGVQALGIALALLPVWYFKL